MKKPLLLLLCLFTVIGYAKDPHIKAVYALIERVTPGYGKQIKLQLIDPANGEDVYEISSEKGKVLLKGNNAIALSTAFNQYLYLQLIIPQYFISNKSGIWSLSLIVHSKG